MINWATTAFVFPGQGSQVVGMGRDFADAYPTARAVYEQADDQLGFALSALCFAGPESELNDTINTQPALFVTSVAILRALQAEYPDAWPCFMAGHSLAEFTAMTAAGAITFSDGLRLTRLRGELMKRAGVDQPGAMAAVLGLDIDAVRETVTRATEQTGRPVVTANDNCRGQVVISGEYTALEQAMVLLRDAGARRVVKLAVSIAAHSPLMQPAADRFHEALAETTFATPQVPVYANRSAAPVTSPEDVLSGLSAQLTGPVRWRESISAMIADGAQTFIEIGPGDVLTGLLRRIDRSKRGYAVNSVQALRNLRAI